MLSFNFRIKKTLTVLLPLTSSLFLTGCGSLTGLNASDDFSCPMTPGVQCRSLSDTYQDSVTGRTPDRLAKEQEIEDAHATQLNTTNQPLDTAVKTSDPSEGTHDEAQTMRDGLDKDPHYQGSENQREVHPKTNTQGRTLLRPMPHVPARVPEVIVTIWMAPWTDDEGDFHEGEKIHARAFDARWASARRRADLANQHRAVVQLPFTNIERHHLPADNTSTEPSVNPTGTTYGAGARAFQTAKRKALEGTNFIEKRFKEAQPLVSDDDSFEEEPSSFADDSLDVVAATEHGRLVSQVENAGAN